MAVDKVVVNAQGVKSFRRALAFGMLNFCFAFEGAAKKHSPVAGGHRSFNPDGPVGGTLRRSVHTVVLLDGQRIGGDEADDNGESLPSYPGDGIVGIIGTNSGYGEWVHNGTSKMPARPFISEALAEVADEAPELILAGVRRHLGGS